MLQLQNSVQKVLPSIQLSENWSNDFMVHPFDKMIFTHLIQATLSSFFKVRRRGNLLPPGLQSPNIRISFPAPSQESYQLSLFSLIVSLESFSGHRETFKATRKFSMLSRNFPGYPEISHAIQKLSRLLPPKLQRRGLVF